MPDRSPPLHLLLIRHATNDWVGKRLAGWTPGVHLNEEGVAQARALADRLAERRIDHVYASPLERAQETAAIVAEPHGLPVQTLEHIELMEDAGIRAKELIKHLLTYARTGKHNPVPMDLNEVIREALTFLRSTVGKEPELVVRQSSGPPPA